MRKLVFIIAVMTAIISYPSDVSGQQGALFQVDVTTVPWTKENYFAKVIAISAELEAERQRYINTGKNDQARVEKLKKHLEEGGVLWKKWEEAEKQQRAKQEQAERFAREQAAERERKYQDAIRRAENAYEQKQYTVAKEAYAEAIKLKPESKNILSAKIADMDIDIHCRNAEIYFNNKQYAKAKDEYATALSISPNSRINYIKGKIADIDAFMLFLKERTYTQYDYEQIKPDDYTAKDRYIKSELLANLVIKKETLPETKVNLVYGIDTLGVTVSRVSSVQNKSLNMVLEKLNGNLKLQPCFMNGYSVNATAEFNYAIKHNHSIVTVKKNAKSLIFSEDNDFNLYALSLKKELNSAPGGKYTFDVSKTVINGREYNTDKLIKMSGTGGSANAFLSLLVPGLGDHRVSYGARKGVGIMITVYGLIGAGAGCKLYSNSEYKLYHEATVQEEMDKHYKRANYSNQAFYICAGTGALVWLYDIIWVASKGAKNKKAQNEYKRSHLGVYHNPEMKVNGLSYTVNF